MTSGWIFFFFALKSLTRDVDVNKLHSNNFVIVHALLVSACLCF